MKVAALICARGGSKRIPRKNVQMCAGKKLIEWVLKAANDAECVDKIFISTDDAEIAEVGRSYDADILKRPWQFATDTAANGSLILHALSEVNKIYHADYVVMLYATSPLIEGWHIDEAYKLLQSKGNAADTVLSVHKMHKTTDIGKIYIKNVDDELHNMWGWHGAPPDIAFNMHPLHVQNGAMVIWKITQDMFDGLPEVTEDLDEHQINMEYAQLCTRRDAKSMMYNIIKTIGYVVDERIGTDINVPMDLVVAEALINYREHLREVCGI